MRRPMPGCGRRLTRPLESGCAFSRPTSLAGVFKARKPFRYLRKAWRMMTYGRWLKTQARAGRFHFLPLSEVEGKLGRAGFVAVEHQLGYARQAYLIRARKAGNAY